MRPSRPRPSASCASPCWRPPSARRACPPSEGSPMEETMAETSGVTTAATARPEQRFTVSHLREEDFKGDGLRTYAKYRDLGIAAATGGMVQAHVIRFVPPCRPEEVARLH